LIEVLIIPVPIFQNSCKMGAVDKYNLKWNDFESGLLTGFQDIRKSQQFFDVTLICEASQIQAHKVRIRIWPDGPFKFCSGTIILTKSRYFEKNNLPREVFSLFNVS
jgi:hypothetical protein